MANRGPGSAAPQAGAVLVNQERRAPADDSLRLLADAAHDLNSSLKLHDVFQRISERVLGMLDCQLFCVMLYDESRQLLEHSFSMCHGRHVAVDGGFPLGHGLSGMAALERRTLRVDDVRHDRRYVRARHPEVDIRSELAVPLVSRGRLIGVLDIESSEVGAFDASHEALLGALASHMAVALDNARLYEAVLQNEKRYESELCTAREVQLALLPSEPPRVPGIELGTAYAPARELGGDFLDFLPYGGGRLALAVGDAAGKAAPAALLGSMAVGMLRGYGFQHRCGPGAMLRYLNDRLRLPRLAPRFLAMAFAVYDELDRSLTLSNGGLPWPYLVRGGVAGKIAVAGMPLGILDGFDYDEVRVDLEEGDVVALCSDGLTECMNGRMDMFGDARMRETLEAHARRSAPEIARALIDAAAAHAGGRDAITDDCAVIVLKAGAA
jgi:sigma-B regulation protein RsbU (phosphoserine phosphatase)